MTYDPARRPRPPVNRARQITQLLFAYWARLRRTHRLLRGTDPMYQSRLGDLRAAIARRDLRQVIATAMRVVIDLLIAARQ